MLKSSETAAASDPSNPSINQFKRQFEYFKSHVSSDNDYPFCLVGINITVRIINLVLRRPKTFYKLKVPVEDLFIENLQLFQETWVKNNYSIRESQKCLLAVESNL